MTFSAKALKEKLDAKKLVETSAVFTEGNTVPTATLSEDKKETELVTDSVQVAPVVEGPHVTETQVVQDTTQEGSIAVVTDEPTPEPPVNLEKKVEEPQPSVEKSVEETNLELAEKEANSSLEEQVATSSEQVIQSTQTLGDTAAFKKLTASADVDVPVIDSYAEMIENMVSSQCQLSGVKNLDLTTFGVRAQVIKFPNLTVLEYGSHKFLGAPFTEQEENSIIHKIALHVASSPKQTIVIRAVQEVRDSNGLVFHSLLFTDAIAQKFVNMFDYTVRVNPDEADVSKLVLIIQK